MLRKDILHKSATPMKLNFIYCWAQKNRPGFSGAVIINY